MNLAQQPGDIAPVVSLVGGVLGLKPETVGNITALLTLLLPVLMFVSAWYARRNPNAMLTTLVHAIEKSTDSGDDVRKAIQGEATARGVQEKLDNFVQKVLDKPVDPGPNVAKLGVLLLSVGLLSGCTAISKTEYKSLLDAAEGYYATVNEPFNVYTLNDPDLHPQSIKNRLEAGPAFRAALDAAKARLDGKEAAGAPGKPPEEGF